MTRHASLLLLGRGYKRPVRFPRCDVTWTTLACVNDDPDILQIPNLKVWDCGHDIENPHNVDFYDINTLVDGRNPWLHYLDTHGQTFANQYCWMLADVSCDMSPFASVTCFGFSFDEDEYIHQLQYIAYHLGILRAKGVGITICEPSALLRPSTYGLKKGE